MAEAAVKAVSVGGEGRERFNVMVQDAIGPSKEKSPKGHGVDHLRLLVDRRFQPSRGGELGSGQVGWLGALEDNNEAHLLLVENARCVSGPGVLSTENALVALIATS
eukprot:CAMPEP_0183299796 /NCGR_PEP_ID=MMETSP0160_2-20130417/6423_1 /TAXON_ID=2839 ORGANISM="Odontella Sinensis, Strain Grunow 1884" /NCGR_SAMPLE_ID=MMETSP0160_2 /ASSEMBLY_ACC=CAM_ASM_000250 /LENGTH=106 /DNA_ID=CAMNT_0025462101 /DNA_START=186 /DNA_END=503 /DNA_ORIENTATION=-